MINAAKSNDEQTSEECFTGHSVLNQITLDKEQNEFSTSVDENDDITPFYVLGYN